MGPEYRSSSETNPVCAFATWLDNTKVTAIIVMIADEVWRARMSFPWQCLDRQNNFQDFPVGFSWNQTDRDSSPLKFSIGRQLRFIQKIAQKSSHFDNWTDSKNRQSFTDSISLSFYQPDIFLSLLPMPLRTVGWITVQKASGMKSQKIGLT